MHSGSVLGSALGFVLLLATIGSMLLATDWLGLHLFWRPARATLVSSSGALVAVLPPAVERLRPRSSRSSAAAAVLDVEDDVPAPHSAVAETRAPSLAQDESRAGDADGDAALAATTDEWGVRSAIDQALSGADDKVGSDEDRFDWNRLRKPASDASDAAQPEPVAPIESAEVEGEVADTVEQNAATIAGDAAAPPAAAAVAAPAPDLDDAAPASLAVMSEGEVLLKRRKEEEEEEEEEEEGEESDEEEDDEFEEEDDEEEDDEEEEEDDEEEFDEDYEEEDFDDDFEEDEEPDDADDEEGDEDEKEEDEEEDEEDEEDEEELDDDYAEEEDDDEEEDEEDGEDDYLTASSPAGTAPADAPVAEPAAADDGRAGRGRTAGAGRPGQRRRGGGSPELTPPADPASPEDQAFRRAVELVLERGKATISVLQESLGVRYFEAAKLLDRLEHEGIIGQYSGALARPVLITREAWNERLRASS
ncbi:MAG: DNA translocase FtsK [Planctomycetota bacterium]